MMHISAASPDTDARECGWFALTLVGPDRPPVSPFHAFVGAVVLREPRAAANQMSPLSARAGMVEGRDEEAGGCDCATCIILHA